MLEGSSEAIATHAAPGVNGHGIYGKHGPPQPRRHHAVHLLRSKAAAPPPLLRGHVYLTSF